ncbi:MAG: hypothetical protein Q7O66_20760 [Dehalococcoidia bacterium]|nr:hypothetical protein [Dehalococcoidia bacterium]
MQRPAHGIYLNKQTCKVVRANSPSAIPTGDPWVLVTSEVNMTLLNIRVLAREQKLVADADAVVWE